MKEKVLIIGFVWPEPNSSAAGSRMMQLINAFLTNNYPITFASAAATSEHAVDLAAIGIKTVSIEINSNSFNEFVKELQPDIVMFDRFMIEEQFGWRVTEECPNTLRILNTEDLHSLRKVRQKCFKANKEFTVEDWLQADITKREIASIYRCDLSLIISDYEIQWLQNAIEMSSELLHYLPFMLDALTEIDSLPAFHERQHFITIGNFRHEPNYDSIIYLKEIIWPLIRKKLPEAEMHVYGSYPMQKVTQLNNEKEGFLIKGWADNAKAVIKNAKVCLAPLRFGAGLKGKFVEAMQCGTPSITTSIGAEGLEERFGGFISDNRQEIADKAIELYTNKTLWNDKQKEGLKLIERFNKAKLQDEFMDRIDGTTQHLNNLRLNNFTGAMLQHQTLKSTKYMSKWIEEKNNS